MGEQAAKNNTKDLSDVEREPQTHTSMPPSGGLSASEAERYSKSFRPSWEPPPPSGRDKPSGKVRPKSHDLAITSEELQARPSERSVAPQSPSPFIAVVLLSIVVTIAAAGFAWFS
ncbi:MAG: hypothetical protein AAF355_13490 [Myxococcota bacterium]